MMMKFIPILFSQLENKGIVKADPEDEGRWNFTEKKHAFKPSIHMPKDACRIFLEVVSVKVERLQDISEEDASAEGVETLGFFPGYNVNSVGKFEDLWTIINGHESWDKNPFVWVVEFNKIDKPAF